MWKYIDNVGALERFAGRTVGLLSGLGLYVVTESPEAGVFGAIAIYLGVILGLAALRKSKSCTCGAANAVDDRFCTACGMPILTA